MKNHSGFTEYCQNYIPDFCSPRTSAPFLFNQARLGNQLTTERAPKRTRYPALKTLRQSSNNSPSHYWSNITKPQRKKERKKDAHQNGRNNSRRPKGRLRNLPSRLHRYSSLTKRKTKPTCDNIPALHV